MTELSIETQLSAVFDEQNALVRNSNSSIVKFILGTAPYTGGLASLLSDSAQKRQERRLRQFLLDLARDVEDVRAAPGIDETKLDEQFIHSDEFVALLEDTLAEAGRTSDSDKLRYLRQYVLGAARSARPDTNWREIFRGYLLRTTGTHLRCLQFVFERQRQVDERDRFGSVRTDSIPTGIGQFTESDAFVRLRLARVCFADLANLGLLVDWRELGNAESQHQSEYCITENGLQLMRFLLGTWDPSLGRTSNQ